MPDEQDANAEIPDMDFDLSGVDTSRPVAAAQAYQAKLNFKVVPQKKTKENPNPTGRNMEVTITLLGEVLSAPNPEDGSQQNLENYKFTTYLPLQAKAGTKDPDQFKKNIAMVADACLGTNKETRPAKVDWNALQDITVMVDVGIEDSTYGRQNRVNKWMHMASTD